MIVIKGYRPKKLFETAKTALAVPIRRMAVSKIGCKTCQEARKKAAEALLKKLGR